MRPRRRYKKQTHAHKDDGAGLQCPECSSKSMTVVQSGSSNYFGGSFWRRRKCLSCGALHHTYELPVELIPTELMT